MITKAVTRVKKSSTGFATDHARAMTGKDNDLAALVKADNPYILPVHCITHRLALAASQSAKDVPYLVKFQRCLVSYFIHSATCIHNIKKLKRFGIIQY